MAEHGTHNYDGGEAEANASAAAQAADRELTVAVTPAQIDEAVSAIHRLGLGIAKILMLEHDDVPRLLVSASCRSLEQLIEVYERRQDGMNVTERAALRRNVHTLATNLHDALDEALIMTKRVRESLAVKGAGE